MKFSKRTPEHTASHPEGDRGCSHPLNNRGLSRKQLDSRIVGKGRGQVKEGTSRCAVFLWVDIGFILKQLM